MPGFELFAQLCDQCIGGFGFFAKEARSFSKTRTNPVAQLFGRGIGKGDDQDLRGQQFSAKAGFLRTVAKNQTQVQRRDGERFACPCAGFDQLTAA